MKHSDKTRVAFRVWPDGDVIAIMPDIPGDYSPYTCTSYMHVGQHSTCDPYMLVNRTRRAAPEEYAGLLAELTSIYGDIQVVQRVNSTQSLERRRQAIQKQEAK